MPESPEVQALAEFLGERMIGRALSGLRLVDPRALKTRARPPAQLVGGRVQQVERFGKQIAIGFGRSWLVVGFGRSGWVTWSDGADDADDADDVDTPATETVARLDLDEGAVVNIVERGAFLAVTVHVVDDPSDIVSISRLGPDPLEDSFTRDDLERALGTRRKQLKALLQEQTSLAGIGNGYSDEILHRAKLAHTVHAAAVDDAARGRLHDAVTGVMRDAAAARRGIPIHLLKQTKAEQLVVHGKAGQRCPVCGDVIRDRRAGSTAAQFCPTCQPEL